MKLAVGTGTLHDREQLASFAIECERVGVDSIWSAEAFGHDGFTPLAFVASRTERIGLGTGVIPIGTRSPTLLAMQSVTMSAFSGGRFILGLGANARAGIEGGHGMPFHPASRHLRDTAKLVRLGASGAQIEYQGEFYTVPLSDQPSFALEPGTGAEFPIYFASLSPKSLEVTGEVADGWVGGASFMPEIAEAFLGPIRAGAERVGRSLDELDIMAPALILPGGPDEALAMARPFVANLLGQHGAWEGNHHAAVYRRVGYGELCDAINARFAAGDEAGAVALVPDELVLNRCLTGDAETIRTRLRAYRDSGATTIQLYPFFPSLTASLETVGRIRGLLTEVEPAGVT